MKVRGETYDSFTVFYYANGKRQRSRFPTLQKAKDEANRIAQQKAQGALGAAALSSEDRHGLQNALALLAKTEGTSKSVFE